MSSKIGSEQTKTRNSTCLCFIIGYKGGGGNEQSVRSGSVGKIRQAVFFTRALFTTAGSDVTSEEVVENKPAL